MRRHAVLPVALYRTPRMVAESLVPDRGEVATGPAAQREAASVADNGSGPCTASFAGDEALQSTLPPTVGHPKMPGGTTARRDQEDRSLDDERHSLCHWPFELCRSCTPEGDVSCAAQCAGCTASEVL